MTHLYATAAPLYIDLGWEALPLPPMAKKKPPWNTTGSNGRTPTDEDYVRWLTEHAAGNLALRLPENTVALDLDLYKPGVAEAWGNLVAQIGSLPPPTWCATGRTDGSGKYLYRVPAGTVFKGEFPGGEILQRHHRYIMAWPSHNPDDNGRRIMWIFDGEVGDDIPCPEDLPELPAEWVAALLADPNRAPREDANVVGSVRVSAYKASRVAPDVHPHVAKLLEMSVKPGGSYGRAWAIIRSCQQLGYTRAKIFNVLSHHAPTVDHWGRRLGEKLDYQADRMPCEHPGRICDPARGCVITSTWLELEIEARDDVGRDLAALVDGIRKRGGSVGWNEARRNINGGRWTSEEMERIVTRGVETKRLFVARLGGGGRGPRPKTLVVAA